MGPFRLEVVGTVTDGTSHVPCEPLDFYSFPLILIISIVSIFTTVSRVTLDGEMAMFKTNKQTMIDIRCLSQWIQYVLMSLSWLVNEHSDLHRHIQYVTLGIIWS